MIESVRQPETAGNSDPDLAQKPPVEPSRAADSDGSPTRQLLLRRESGPLRRVADDSGEIGHRSDRSVGMWKIDVSSVPEPDERHHSRHACRRRRAARRGRHLRTGSGRRRPPAPRGNGVPEVESLSEVHLRQRRVRPSDQRHRPTVPDRRAGREVAQGSGAVGRSEGSIARTRRSGSREASSSGSALPARSRSSRK